MQRSNEMNEAWGQRIVILVLLGVLAVAAAYVWGTRLSAGSDLSLSQAPQYDTLRGVAAIRAADASASNAGAAYASRVLQHEARGVAAVRAADAATGPAFTGLQGVAAVRAADQTASR
jgi:hypothetical protein